MPNLALIGASENPESLAFRLFTRLREGGFEVIPINPNYQMIAGIPCFASLAELKIAPEVVIFMVNPKLTLQILPQVVELQIKKVWFQPGSFDDSVIAKAEALGLKINTTHCILIAPQNLVEEFVNND